MSDSKPLKIVILGGGTAGWVSAAILSKGLAETGNSVTVVDTAEIPTIGVGEASIPTIYELLRNVGLSDADLIKEAEATFKYGIQFENWSKVGESYMHSFGNMGHNLKGIEFFKIWLSSAQYFSSRDLTPFMPAAVAAYADRFARVAVRPDNAEPHHYYPMCEISYALHFDAALLARLLKRKSLENGASHLSKHVVDVISDETGISALKTDDGELIEADVFVDCSGMRGVLSRQELASDFENWQSFLPCDTAIAVQTELTKTPRLYTRSIAHEAGWRWEIQLQNRTGNGIVYCSDFMSEDEATSKLLSEVEGKLINEPRKIPFKTGRLNNPWQKNCVAIGLSAGFLEPLESTSIHLICKYANLLGEALGKGELAHETSDEFNMEWRRETEEIRDFLMAHYVVNQRDEPFWKKMQTCEQTAGLKRYLSELHSMGWLSLSDQALFGHDSWFEVLVGQGFNFDYQKFSVQPAQAQQHIGFLQNVAGAVQAEVSKIQNSHKSMIESLRA